MQKYTLRPRIVVADIEHRQLWSIAAGSSSSAGETLLEEMERARVVPARKLPNDIVKMGSRVRYRTSGGDEKDVTLVFPAQADISEAKISVLTPVGAALIGLRTGQSITLLSRGGSTHVLTVLSVVQDGLEDNSQQ